VRKQHLVWLTLLLTVGILLMASPALAEGELPDDGITVWGEDYTLDAGDRLEGDLVVFNGSAFLEVASQVEGSVIVWRGDAEVDGTIENDLVVSDGEIALGENALIEGNVICSWSCDIQQDEGAHVEGVIIEGTRLPLPDLPFTPELRLERERGFKMPFPVTGWAAAPGSALRFALRVLRGIGSILVIAVVAGLVALIWPQQTARIGQTIVEAPGQTFGIGLLAGAAAIAAAVVLALTFCMAPAAAVIAIALAAAAFFGWIGAGAMVGERLLEALNARKAAPMWAAGLGTLLISLVTAGLGIVRCVGILGGIATFVLGCIGLGAVVLTRFGTTPFTSGRAGAQPDPPAPPPIRFDGTSGERDGADEFSAPPAAPAVADTHTAEQADSVGQASEHEEAAEEAESGEPSASGAVTGGGAAISPEASAEAVEEEAANEET
jgi:hypothetical protein